MSEQSDIEVIMRALGQLQQDLEREARKEAAAEAVAEELRLLREVAGAGWAIKEARKLCDDLAPVDGQCGQVIIDAFRQWGETIIRYDNALAAWHKGQEGRP